MVFVDCSEVKEGQAWASVNSTLSETSKFRRRICIVGERTFKRNVTFANIQRKFLDTLFGLKVLNVSTAPRCCANSHLVPVERRKLAKCNELGLMALFGQSSAEPITRY